MARTPRPTDSPARQPWSFVALCSACKRTKTFGGKSDIAVHQAVFHFDRKSKTCGPDAWSCDAAVWWWEGVLWDGSVNWWCPKCRDARVVAERKQRRVE